MKRLLNTDRQRFLLSVMDLSVVALIASLLIYAYHKAVEDPERYLRGVSVIISDARYPADPAIIYDRTVVKDFYGQWVIKVINVDQFLDVACHGTGESYFEKGPKTMKMELSRFTKLESCKDLPVGTYLARIHWIINQDPDTILSYTTNNFTIYDEPLLLK